MAFYVTDQESRSSRIIHQGVEAYCSDALLVVRPQVEAVEAMCGGIDALREAALRTQDEALQGGRNELGLGLESAQAAVAKASSEIETRAVPAVLADGGALGSSRLNGSLAANKGELEGLLQEIRLVGERQSEQLRIFRNFAGGESSSGRLLRGWGGDWRGTDGAAWWKGRVERAREAMGGALREEVEALERHHRDLEARHRDTLAALDLSLSSHLSSLPRCLKPEVEGRISELDAKSRQQTAMGGVLSRGMDHLRGTIMAHGEAVNRMASALAEGMAHTGKGFAHAG